MKSIGEIFEGGSLSGEEFESRLKDAGIVLLDAVEGGYVPASRELELTEALEKQKQSHEASLKSVKARAALVCELTRSGAHNPALAAGAIGLDGLDGDDAALAKGAKEKVALFKSSEPYMFAEEGLSSAAAFSTGLRHQSQSVDPDSMSDSEYYRYRKTI